MRTNSTLKAAKYGYIVLSVLISALGITLMAVPDFSVSMLCWIGGILLIAFGCIKIVGYLSKDLYRLAFQYDLAFGILLIVLGVILIWRTDAMIHLIGILLGIFILADSLLKIQIAIDSKTFGIGTWWVILTEAVITAVLGVLLLVRPHEGAEAITMLLGASLLGEGILSLTTVLIAVKIVKRNIIDEA